MKIAEQIARIANKILMICTVGAALLLFVFSMYVLYDTFYTNRNAFTSYDLLQYRPKATAAAEDGKESFAELQRINPDTVGWLEFYDTNISYPVVQGRDDLEYAGKDIYGYNSLTGSIYLASENESDFNDWYNLIYGHHMDNGAMFGDIDKYRDPDYFYTHQKGILQTPDGNYELTVIACVVTDSYESIIYSVASKDISQYPELHDYIENNSLQFDAEHDRRELGGPEPEPEPPVILKAIGHLSEEQHWAFLNLICALLTVLILLPLFFLRRKYRQMRYAKRKAKELDEEPSAEKICKDLRKFVRKMRVGVILELLLAAAAVIVFLLTENIMKPVVIRDSWTWLMLLIAYLALLADFICFRYRGRRPEEPAEQSREN